MHIKETETEKWCLIGKEKNFRGWDAYLSFLLFFGSEENMVCAQKMKIVGMQ